MKVKEAMNALNKINEDIKSIVNKSSECDFGDNINYEDNPDDRMLRNQIHNVLSKLNLVKNKLNYLNKPILLEGYLKKNTNNRYELEEIEFSCGSTLEVLIRDPYDEEEYWAISTIEHNSHDYYIKSGNFIVEGIALQNLKVRVRE